MWARRLHARANFLWQSSQECGLSPVNMFNTRRLLYRKNIFTYIKIIVARCSSRVNFRKMFFDHTSYTWWYYALATVIGITAGRHSAVAAAGSTRHGRGLMSHRVSRWLWRRSVVRPARSGEATTTTRFSVFRDNSRENLLVARCIAVQRAPNTGKTYLPSCYTNYATENVFVWPGFSPASSHRLDSIEWQLL